ncbi:MAG: uroporphyrinogen decarboxylase family protein [Phycisphaerae bacterium]|nr:uroporphyrinogen decarboxylase family protein [Phycisphaerae bacterium]
MTSDLEVYRQTMSFRRPGRVLFAADFTPDLRERLVKHTGSEDLLGHYGMWKRAWVGPRRPEGLAKIDYSVYYKDDTLPPGTTIDDSGVAHIPGGFYHFTKMLSPLRNATSIEQIQSYPLDNTLEWDWSQVKADVDKAHAEGIVVGAWVGHMYESAWQIRGYEEFLTDMLTQPAWAHAMLERVIETKAERCRRLAEAGVDVLQCGDDVASQRALMFEPAMWREFMLSRWRKVWAAAHAANPGVHVWYHSDGDITAIIGELIEAGVNILNPLQPECLDVDAVFAEFGGRVAFDGVMGTQSTMPWGTPADVKARVKEIIQKYGQNGGLFVTPTHILEPEVPLANIDAFADACREYGQG